MVKRMLSDWEFHVRLSISTQNSVPFLKRMDSLHVIHVFVSERNLDDEVLVDHHSGQNVNRNKHFYTKNRASTLFFDICGGKNYTSVAFIKHQPSVGELQCPRQIPAKKPKT